jgi:uncharacterized membrane protein
LSRAGVRLAGYTARVPTSRIEAFSDGVFAIAITLLVLEIQPPKPSGHGLWHDLGTLWPSYTAFVVSFFTIGTIWVNHHAQFARIVRADRTLMFTNLLLLMWVSFIPFPTSLLADSFKRSAHEDVAAAVYAGTFLAMGLSFFASWTHVARGRLLDPAVTPRQLQMLTRRNALGEVGYAIAVAIAFVSPAASLALCGVVALYYVHPGRAERLDAEPA